MSSLTPSADQNTIPVVDIAPLLTGGLAERQAVAALIGAACRDIGFFAIRGHGVDAALLDQVFDQSARFFAQSPEVKAAVSITRSRANRGYVALEGESLDPEKMADVKEAFNVGRAPDPGEVVAEDAPSQGANLWPALDGFREPISAYYEACRRLCERLHMAFALDLGLPEDYFAPFIDRPMATLRLLRYPPHPGVFDGSRFGAGTHTDYGNVTLLAQHLVGGLEVRARSGDWIRVEPSPGTLICNIGDCLMRWSNDVYVSTPHQVINLGERERYSVAFFFDPNPDALVACLPTCASPERPPRYEPITGAAYLRSRLDATYAFRRPSA
jgi:isopenicillin N synthase-like dioxygenase